jgi:Ca2+-binding EF-hand superfamily protein
MRNIFIFLSGSMACLIVAAVLTARQHAAAQPGNPPPPAPQAKPAPAGAQPKATSRYSTPLVPGFGEPADPSLPRVEGFGVVNGPISSLPVFMNEAEIRDYSKNLLDRYDTDRSGALERDNGEWKEMKNEFKAADRDNNDVVSLEELVGWLTEYNRNRLLPFAGTQFAELPLNASVMQIRNHALNLMNTFDKNRSGVLERDEGEWKDMKNELKAADKDNNDIVTLDELINWVAQDNRAKSTPPIPAANPLSALPLNAEPPQILEFAKNLMLLLDKNKNGALERDNGEWGALKNELKIADKDANDIISFDELYAWLVQFNQDRALVLTGNPLAALPNNANATQIKDFAKNLIGIMDKNKNGALERDNAEWGNLKNELKAADKDANDIVTMDELIAWLTQYLRTRPDTPAGAKPTTGLAAKPAPATATSSTAGNTPKAPSGTLLATPPATIVLPKWFGEKDGNKNNMVELWEFIGDNAVTDEKVADFAQYDLNSDWVLTAQEVMQIERKKAAEQAAKKAEEDAKKAAELEAKKSADQAAKKAEAGAPPKTDAAKPDKTEPPAKKEKVEPPAKKEKAEPPGPVKFEVLPAAKPGTTIILQGGDVRVSTPATGVKP